MGFSYQPEGQTRKHSAQPPIDLDHEVLSLGANYRVKDGPVSMLIGGGMIDFRQARRTDPTDYPEWVHDGLGVAQDNLYPNTVVLPTPRKPGNMYAAGTEIGFQDYTLYLRYDLLQEPILPDQDIRMGGIALERIMGHSAMAPPTHTHNAQTLGNTKWTKDQKPISIIDKIITTIRRDRPGRQP